MPRLRPPAALLLALSACTAPNPAFLVGSASDGQTSTAATSTDTTATSTPPSTDGGSGGQTASGSGVDPTGDVSTTLPVTSSTTAAPDMGVMSSSGGNDLCGNGVNDPGEQCDEGPNNSDGGTCTSQCQLAACGDGLIGPAEQCDEGVLNSDEGTCTSQCNIAFCGDGLVHADVEQCDDGNNNDEDGCQADCTLLEIEKMVAGGSFTCALLSHGKVRCWGGNAHGQLGLGDIQTRGDNPGELPTPYVELGEAAAVDIAAANESTCAVLETGAVRCWGRNDFGQLGVGSTQTLGDDLGELPPKTVVLGQLATTITGGVGFFCVRTVNNTVRCWGSNSFGQMGRGFSLENIGDNPADNLALDVPVGMPNVAHVFAGAFHACAVGEGGGLRCWGHGQAGKLGYDSTNNLGDNPNEMPPPEVMLGGAAADGGGGGAHTCARLATNRVRCWGDGTSGKLATGGFIGIGGGQGFMLMKSLLDIPFAPPEVDVVQLAVGNQHACALVTGGAVRCWGANPEGQLGLGHVKAIGDDLSELPLATEVGLGEPALAIYSGASAGHTCAVLGEGRVRCWGRNLSGQLGLGSLQNIGDNELPLFDTPVLPAP